MSKEMMTITISDTVVRLMVTDGKHVTDWAELPFEPGVIEGNIVAEPDVIAAKINQLLEIKTVSVKKVLVGIGGMRCLTRPVLLPKQPNEILDEAVRREAERVLPVPLDELYMSWQTIPAAENQTQVFLTAIPKRIVDPLMETLDKAGLKPIFMDLKPLLLARISDGDTAILVDVQELDFDIVVLVKGIPQPIRTVPFRGENPTLEEKLSVISEELDRTITFYNGNHPETAIENDLPVQISGDLGEEEEFKQKMSEFIGREVKALRSPLEMPEGFNPLPYMANIGLLLQVAAQEKHAGASFVNLNTLPMEYRPQPVSSLNILKMLGIVFAVLLVLVMGFMIQNTISGINTKKTSLESSRILLNQRQIEVQTLTNQVKDLETQITNTQALKDSLTTALATLELRTLGLNMDIDATMHEKPFSIQLTQISHENNILTITGIAPSEKTVLNYYLGLIESGRFADIEVTSLVALESETEENPGMEFTLQGSVVMDTNWLSSMEVILGNLPNAITLSFASTVDYSLTLTGNTPDESLLLDYLKTLDQSGKFDEININSIIRIEDDTYNFQVVLRIGEPVDEDDGDGATGG